MISCVFKEVGIHETMDMTLPGKRRNNRIIQSFNHSIIQSFNHSISKHISERLLACGCTVQSPPQLAREISERLRVVAGLCSQLSVQFCIKRMNLVL